MIIAARILYVLCLWMCLQEFGIEFVLKMKKIKIDKVDFCFNIFFLLIFLYSLFFTDKNDLYFSVFFLAFSITSLALTIIEAHEKFSEQINKEVLKDLKKKKKD